jgi:hypothetical protein
MIITIIMAWPLKVKAHLDPKAIMTGVLGNQDILA